MFKQWLWKVVGYGFGFYLLMSLVSSDPQLAIVCYGIGYGLIFGTGLFLFELKGAAKDEQA